MKKLKIFKSFFIFSALFFLLSGCVSTGVSKFYRLYIGTNDKESCKLEIPVELQKEKILQIVTKYTSGVTIYEATGYWKDKKQKLVFEKTLVCEFYDISEDSLEKISCEILKELNQNSILYVKSDCERKFIQKMQKLPKT